MHHTQLQLFLYCPPPVGWPARLAKSKEEKCRGIVQLNFIIFATKLQRFSCAKVCAWSDKETGFWRIFSHNNFLFSQLIFKKKELHHISGFFLQLSPSCFLPFSSFLLPALNAGANSFKPNFLHSLTKICNETTFVYNLTDLTPDVLIFPNYF